MTSTLSRLSSQKWSPPILVVDMDETHPPTTAKSMESSYEEDNPLVDPADLPFRNLV